MYTVILCFGAKQAIKFAITFLMIIRMLMRVDKRPQKSFNYFVKRQIAL